MPMFDPFLEDYRADSAYIHESSYVDSPCRIGEQTHILHFSHIMPYTIIGDACRIGRNVTISTGVILGNHVRVQNNAQLNSGVILEDEVFCGASVVFVESRHIRANPKNISKVSPTLVRQGTEIGPNSVVASGFTIGAFVFIEAGTIVDRNIPDFAVAYGNPLKFSGWRCECGQGITFSTPKASVSCQNCERQYLRQSQWKVVQLAQGGSTLDSHSEFDPTIRISENGH